MAKHRFVHRGQAILTAFLVLTVFIITPSITVHGKETDKSVATGRGNDIYDALKSRIQEAWNKGMDGLEEVNPIEISGNFAERILRTIAATCYSHLKSMKAGALLTGLISFLLGAMIALLSQKDKKMRKIAISVGMIAVPTLLIIFIFGISWFISIFR